MKNEGSNAIARPDRLLDTPEAAQFVRLSESTLRHYRHANNCGRDVGPRWVKVGPRLVRYRESDLVAFLEGGAR